MSVPQAASSRIARSFAARALITAAGWSWSVGETTALDGSLGLPHDEVVALGSGSSVPGDGKHDGWARRASIEGLSQGIDLGGRGDDGVTLGHLSHSLKEGSNGLQRAWRGGERDR